MIKFQQIVLVQVLLSYHYIQSSGVVPSEDGGFEVHDWDEYERGSRTFHFVLSIPANSHECFCEHLLDESKIFLSFEVMVHSIFDHGEPLSFQVLTGSSRTMDYFFEHERGRFSSKFGFTFDTLQISINETSNVISVYSCWETTVATFSLKKYKRRNVIMIKCETV